MHRVFAIWLKLVTNFCFLLILCQIYAVSHCVYRLKIDRRSSSARRASQNRRRLLARNGSSIYKLRRRSSTTVPAVNRRLSFKTSISGVLFPYVCGLLLIYLHMIFTRESRMLRASLPSPWRPSVRLSVRLSVCLSVTLVNCIKTVQARITKSSQGL